MKFSTLFQVALLPLAAIAASKRASSDIFSDFYSKQLSKQGPLSLSDKTFSQITATPRNYSALVVLTALETRFGCKLCQEFDEEWELLAKSWTRGDKQGESRLLIGTLDFVDGKQTFQSMGMQTAPWVLLYPPTVGEGAKADGQPHKLDFATGPMPAENLHQWVSRHMPASVPKPPVYRPFNYGRFVTFTTIFVGGVTLLFVAWGYISPIIHNRNLWAALSLIAILLFTTGHMYNHIRGAPYIAGDGKGGISYFAGGFQAQYGLESQIIAAIYGVLAFSTIFLALHVPRMTNVKSQQVAVMVSSAVIWLTYSFLLRIFKLKQGGYPYWLPPF